MDGGDMILKDYMYGQHNSNQRMLFPKSDTPISLFFAVNLLIMFQCGDDSMYLDEALSCGIINSLVAAAIPLILTQLSYALFIRSWRYNVAVDFPHVVYDAFNSKFLLWIVNIIYIISFINLSSVYVEDACTYIENIFAPKIYEVSFLTNKFFLGYVGQLVFTVPFLFLPKFSSFKILSLIANFCVIFTVVVAIYFMCVSIKNDGFDPNKEIVIADNDFWGFISVMSYFNNLFYSHPTLSAIAKDMASTKIKSVTRVTFISTLFTYFITLAGGYATHFMFFGSIGWDDNCIDYFPDHPLKYIGRITSAINTVITNASTVYLAAGQLYRLFNNQEPRVLERVFSGIIIILISFAIMTLDDTSENTFNVIGSFISILLGYIIPSACFLKMAGIKSLFGVSAVVVIIVSLTFGILICYNDYFHD